MRKIVLSILILFTFSQCKEVTEKTIETIENTQKLKIEGKFFSLQKEGIKIFLPKEFNRIEKENYIDFLKSISINDADIETEKRRIIEIEKGGHEVYLFEYIGSGSILNVITTKYIPFDRDDAQMLLNSIKMEHDHHNYEHGFNFEKLEAKFMGSKETHIFKAIYKVTPPDELEDKHPFFKQIYFVSFNKKTFSLMLETPELVDFDPYLEKIRVL
ncbi:MAG: hypothetical protein ACK4RM_01840 [Flavobacterium sp.]